jgi:hypothetical protein
VAKSKPAECESPYDEELVKWCQACGARLRDDRYEARVTDPLALAVTLEVHRQYLGKVYGTDVHWQVTVEEPDTIRFVDQSQNLLEAYRLEDEGRLVQLLTISPCCSEK